jgi:hypothetical protein
MLLRPEGRFVPILDANIGKVDTSRHRAEVLAELDACAPIIGSIGHRIGGPASYGGGVAVGRGRNLLPFHARPVTAR